MNPVILVLPPPISANAYWGTRVITPRGGRPMAMPYVTHEARAYKNAVVLAARAAGVRAPIAGRIQIDIRLYPGRPQDWAKRQRQLGAAWDDSVRCIDLDNANKVLLDALKDVVMEDDKWVRRIISERMEPDEHGARVVVRVMALQVEQPQLALAGVAA